MNERYLYQPPNPERDLQEFRQSYLGKNYPYQFILAPQTPSELLMGIKTLGTLRIQTDATSSQPLDDKGITRIPTRMLSAQGASGMRAISDAIEAQEREKEESYPFAEEMLRSFIEETHAEALFLPFHYRSGDEKTFIRIKRLAQNLHIPIAFKKYAKDSLFDGGYEYEYSMDLIHPPTADSKDAYWQIPERTLSLSSKDHKRKSREEDDWDKKLEPKEDFTQDAIDDLFERLRKGDPNRKVTVYVDEDNNVVDRKTRFRTDDRLYALSQARKSEFGRLVKERGKERIVKELEEIVRLYAAKEHPGWIENNYFDGPLRILERIDPVQHFTFALDLATELSQSGVFQKDHETTNAADLLSILADDKQQVLRKLPKDVQEKYHTLMTTLALAPNLAETPQYHARIVLAREGDMRLLQQLQAEIQTDNSDDREVLQIIPLSIYMQKDATLADAAVKTVLDFFSNPTPESDALYQALVQSGQPQASKALAAFFLEAATDNSPGNYASSLVYQDLFRYANAIDSYAILSVDQQKEIYQTLAEPILSVLSAMEEKGEFEKFNDSAQRLLQWIVDIPKDLLESFVWNSYQKNGRLISEQPFRYYYSLYRKHFGKIPEFEEKVTVRPSRR